MTADSDRFYPRETSEGWVLELGDAVVTQIRIDYAFGFTVEAAVDLRIEGPFSFDDGETVSAYDPAQWATLGPLLALHQAIVTSAVAHESGRLVVRFAAGEQLTVEPRPQYESFTVSSSEGRDGAGFLIVGLPGGGLARF